MSEERDWEGEARVQGWRPQEEFEGDSEQWVDAETFVTRGEQWAGTMKNKLKHVEGELENVKRTNKELSEFFKSSLAKEEKKRRELEVQLEAQRAEAISNADGEAYLKADRELQELREEHGVQRPPEQGPDPATAQWLEDNPWYRDDPILRGAADAIADQVAARNPTLQGKDFLDKVTELVKQELPNKFKADKPKGDPVESEGGTKSSEAGTSVSYSKLPAEAKAACDNFVKQGLMTREEYVKIYNRS